MPTLGSLFAGIGGFDLGFERAGWQCKWQVELNSHCREVLKKHWPHVHQHDDVKTWPTQNTELVDAIVGGFPCQDISSANIVNRNGLQGNKSGLAYEFIRIVEELRPTWTVIENSGGSWRLWVPFLRRELHFRGYSSVPIRLRASDVGAPHDRDRVFIVANSDRKGECLRPIYEKVASLCQNSGRLRDLWRNSVLKCVGDDDGISGRMASMLGNAVVPQVSEVIGKAILEVGF